MYTPFIVSAGHSLGSLCVFFVCFLFFFPCVWIFCDYVYCFLLTLANTSKRNAPWTARRILNVFTWHILLGRYHFPAAASRLILTDELEENTLQGYLKLLTPAFNSRYVRRPFGSEKNPKWMRTTNVYSNLIRVALNPHTMTFNFSVVLK